MAPATPRSRRPRSGRAARRWKAWLCALTKPGSWQSSATRERIRACCGASWSWGWQWACLCAARGRARRNGRDLLLPLVRHAGARRRLAALEPERPPAAGRPLLALLSRRSGPYSSSDPRVVAQQMAEIARGGHRRGRRLLVGARLGRGRAAAARRRGGAAARAARRHPPRAVRRAARRRPSRPTSSTSRRFGVRDVYVYHPRDFAAADWAAVRAQVPSTMRLFAGTELVGFAAAGRFDGFYTYDFLDVRRREVRAPLRAGARARTSLCAPSVGPGYDGRAGGRAAAGATAPQRRDLRRALDRGARARTPTSSRSRASTSGARARRSSPRRPGTGYASYDGAWGLLGSAGPDAPTSAHGVLDRAAFTRA